MGTLVAIYLRSKARVAAVATQHAIAVAGKGLDGDHSSGGKRQVTLLDQAAWAAACAELGRELDPSLRRANLLVHGLDLSTAIGGTIAIGEVVIDVLGETEPCRRMDEDGQVGMQAALRTARRGGVYGRIRNGGELRTGMTCTLLPPATDRDSSITS